MTEAERTPITEHSITRFRTQYDTVQDRITLTGEVDNTDAVIVVHLTQRLLLRLIPRLSNALNAPQISQSKDPVSLHQFAQSAASEVVNTRVEKPIATPSVQSAAILPRELKLAASPKELKIRFSDPERGNRVYALTLSALHLRQWLSILYGQFRVAEWPQTVFPSWIGTAPDTSPTSSIVH